MAYTYPVKWMRDSMRGAPQISGTAGTLIGALDAFLLTGFGTVTALSVTVASGIGTATVNAGSYFDDYAVVLIAGATPTALNGEARVLSHTNTSITFETDAPDGTATGTITIKYAPVGSWEKTYSGTNIACYRSTDVLSPGQFLRVDDTGTLYARVVGYESMTDANTGSGPFPTTTLLSGGGYWHKSASANATAVRYAFAADSRALLTAVEPATASNATYRTSNIRGFGDPIVLAPGGDAWATFLSASGVNLYSLSGGTLCGGDASSSSGFAVAPRSFTALGSAVWLNVSPFTGVPAGISGNDTTLGAAPSQVDGQIKLARLFLREQSPVLPARAVAPGALYVPQSGLTSIVTPGDIATGSGDFAGRKLLAVGAGTSANATPTGIALIDITGPWR